MLVELIRDNRHIVDRISHTHIKLFISLLENIGVCIFICVSTSLLGIFYRV